MTNFYLIGYSGHAFVVAESALNSGQSILGYFETEEKKLNPYHLKFFGNEELVKEKPEFKNQNFFVGIGDNVLRSKIFAKLNGFQFAAIIDRSAHVSSTTRLKSGIYIGKGSVINALSQIGEGAIINTGAIVEHECSVGDFSHIAPGAILCGNVKVGNHTIIGAGAVIRQGITIGNNVCIGAGSVVVKNIPDRSTAFGNPAIIR